MLTIYTLTCTQVHTQGGGQVDAEDLMDFFNQAMGGAPRGAGRDVQTAVRLTFFEAAHGCSKEVNFEYFVRDPSSPNANNRRSQPKKIRKTRNVKLDIPAGVDTGITMRMKGQGAEGDPGFPAGDLLVQLEVLEDPYFKRSDNDVFVEVPISVTQVKCAFVLPAYLSTIPSPIPCKRAQC